MNYEKTKANIIDVCNFYQRLDCNGAFLDDLDERMQPENLKFEIEVLLEITAEWSEDGYLDADEVEWLKNKLTIVTE